MVLVVPLALAVAAFAVARGGGRPRPALLVAALVAAVAAGAVAGLAVEGDDTVRALAWSVVPVALTAADLAASRSARAPAVHAGVVVGAAAFVLVTGFSIGLLFVPALALLAVAGFGGREPAYVRR